MKIKLVRTIHPVGHGCFCTERFFSETSNICNYIYDCGSDTLDAQALKNLIDGEFIQDTTIDAIFISHFHDDHLNGIQHLIKRCRVKQLIVPLVDTEGLLLYFIHNAIYGNIKLSDFIESLCLNEQISETEIPILKIGKSNSNHSLDVCKKGLMWQYVPIISPPYRSLLVKQRTIGKLIETLSNENVFKNVIVKKNPLKINYALFRKIILSSHQHMETLKRIYKGYKLHDNKFNLALLSSLTNNIFSSLDEERGEVACLFMGDYEARPKYRYDYIKNRIGQLWQGVSLMQVTHHGSILSHNESLYHKNMNCFVCDSSSSHRPKQDLYDLQQKKALYVILFQKKYKANMSCLTQ